MEPENLLYGGKGELPRSVATCPECDAALYVHSMAWDEFDGKPIDCDLDIDCTNDAHLMRHRYWQSDWQPVLDAVRKWSGAISPDLG